MGRARVSMSRAGAAALLRSEAVRADLEARALRVARAANAAMSPDGYVTATGYRGGADVGRARARGFVVTSDDHGKADNARHGTLLKSLDEGR